MKEEWKPEELRATSEEIRGAVMPKSITPEMVGGTLLGVVNALGEVVEVLGEIPRERVRVKCRAYDVDGEISTAGATVYVDRWCVGGFPVNSYPREELTVNEDGIAEFDVPYGYKFAVFSKLPGSGASFQWVFEASQELRELELWNQPIGVFAQWCIGFYDDNDEEYYPYLPAVMPTGESAYDNPDKVMSANRQGSYPDETHFFGVLVSTEDTSFVIPENDNEASMSDEPKVWVGSRNMSGLIPTLPAINNHTEAGKWQGDYAEAQNRARADMDGNMNTAKISDFCKSAPAADWASDSGEMWQEQRWLPSAGQLYLIYLNRAAIDAILKEYGITDNLTSTLNKYYWSSTQFDESCSWVVSYNGLILTDTRTLLLLRRAGGVGFSF